MSPHTARTKPPGTAALALPCGLCLGWGLPWTGGMEIWGSMGTLWAPGVENGSRLDSGHGSHLRGLGSERRGVGAADPSPCSSWTVWQRKLLRQLKGNFPG